MNVAIQNDLNELKAAEIKDLETLSRIVANAQNLIHDVSIQGTHAKAVVEILEWLQAVHDKVQGQLKTLKPSFASVGTEQDSKVIDAEVVKEQAKV